MGIEGLLIPVTIRLVVGALNQGSFEGLVSGILFGIIGFILLALGGYFYQWSIAKLIG